jgi:starch synthase
VKVLFVASEATPLVKVGGLADVVGSLPKALIGLGHDVRVMLPDYSSIDAGEYAIINIEKDIDVHSENYSETVDIKEINVNNIKFYLIDNVRFLHTGEVYGEHEIERFYFFCKAVIASLNHMTWKPDIVHCHDWHTALVPLWLKNEHSPARSMFTIHNLAYQGSLNQNFLTNNAVMKFWQLHEDYGPEPLHNFMSIGILWSDMVTTVSEQYAREVITTEYGAGMEQLLEYRKKDLRGIINGIDYDEYNPSIDPLINTNYDANHMIQRVKNKNALQKKVGLPEDEKVPLIGMVSRLDEQKGFDILSEMLYKLFNKIHCQMVILGKGLEKYHRLLISNAGKYPNQLKVEIGFDDMLAHLIYSGCDMFLMPSRFEPCGLGQLIAMRYGAVPIVRHTGGLVDTVKELSPNLDSGSGFVFEKYDAGSLYSALEHAVNAFENRKEDWQKVAQRIMSLDFSWSHSARKYEAVYQQILAGKGG